MSSKVNIDHVKPILDHVMVVDMNFDAKTTAGGILLTSDNGKTEGIKPRWGRVYAIGPQQSDVNVGEWILIDHGRWTRGFTFIDADGNDIIARFVDVKDIILADDHPHDEFGELTSPSFGPTHRPEDFLR